MYVREINGEVTTFGVSGSLWRDAMVMYDRLTNSIWSQVSGKSIKGKLTGMQLQAVPMNLLKWKEWRKLHPDSKVLKKERGAPGSSYESYFSSRTRHGIFGTPNLDKRLDGKELVLGILLNGIPTVFPHKFLEKEKVVNYSSGGGNLLIVYSGKAATSLAFNPEVEGRTLTFEPVESDDVFLISDKETGTLWDGLKGEAVSGSLEGAKLEQLVGTQAFWFGWRGFYPKTVIWGL